MSHIPKLLQNFEVYVEGTSLSASGIDAKLPGLVHKVKEHQGGGMYIPVDVPVGLEKLDMSFGSVEYSPALIGLIGRPNTQLTFRGYARGHDGEEQTVVCYATGFIREASGMDHKPGEADYELAYVMNCTHCSLEIDGAIVLDIDAVNGKFIVGGVDLLAGMRAALGR